MLKKVKDKANYFFHFLDNSNYKYVALLSGFFLGSVFTFPEYIYFLAPIPFVPVFHFLSKREKDFGFFIFYFVLAYYFTYCLFLFDLLPLEWALIYDPVYGFFLITISWILFSLTLSFPQVLTGFIKNVKFNKYFSFIFLFTFFEFVKAWTMSFFLYSEKVLIGPHHTYGDLGYILVNFYPFKYIFPYFGSIGATFLLLILGLIVYKIIFTLNKKYIYLFLIIIAIFILLKPEYIAEEDSLYLGNLNLKPNYKLVISAKDFLPTFKNLQEREKLIILPENLRTFSDQRYFKDYNLVATENINSKQTSFLLSDGNMKVLHEKVHLMPMGEYRLKIFEILFLLINGTKWNEFFENTENRVNPGEKVANQMSYTFLICGEVISTFLTNKSIREGDGAVIVPASLRPFNEKRNSLEKLKLYYQARALETGKYVLIAGYNVNSMVINSDGVVEHSFSAGQKIFQINEVTFKVNKVQTFYNKFLKLFFL